MVPRSVAVARASSRRALALAFALVLPALVFVPRIHADESCVVRDNGSGSAVLPPPCWLGYTSAERATGIRDGLAPGDALVARYRLFNLTVATVAPGGPLGGSLIEFDGRLQVTFDGIGSYAGYHREIVMPIQALGSANQIATAPTVPASLQQFPVVLWRFFTQITGDTDFDLLRITAGTDFGLPSPGHVVMTKQANGEWAVDSYFDMRYRVDFVGAITGPFIGLSGSTNGQTTIAAGDPHHLTGLYEPPGGGGFGQIPVEGTTGYDTRRRHTIADDGLVPGRPYEGRLRLRDVVLGASAPGGPLGGSSTLFTGVVEAEATLDYLGGVRRTLSLPASGRVALGPRTPAVPVEGVPADLEELLAQLPLGDPDFDLLRITAGSNFGMPSRGHTILRKTANGNWAIDSFFDITYRTDFVGHIPGPIQGQSGSSTHTGKLSAGTEPGHHCLVPSPTPYGARFPVECPGGYDAGPGHVFLVDAGGSNSAVQARMRLDDFVINLEGIGGTLGMFQTWNARVYLDLVGYDTFAGYTRSIAIPVEGESRLAPRTATDPLQSLPDELYYLQGSIAGDLDFNLLRITAGAPFGMPSPGHTTLTDVGGGNWSVDSFFDITYDIEYIGSPIGPFAGISGTKRGVGRFRAGPVVPTGVPAEVASVLRLSAPRPQPSSAGATAELSLPSASHVRATIHDLAGRRVAAIADARLEAGHHPLAWNGRTASGDRAKPGVYFLRVEALGTRLAERLVVIR